MGEMHHPRIKSLNARRWVCQETCLGDEKPQTIEKNIRRSWHLGTGTGQWGRINVERAKETCSGLICANSPNRRKQLEVFQENAQAGDEIFLHVKGMVQYVGIYTGKCCGENMESPCPMLQKLGKCKLTVEQQKARENSVCDREDDKATFIFVDSWRKLHRPFPGEGKRATLYEAPDYSRLSVCKVRINL